MFYLLMIITLCCICVAEENLLVKNTCIRAFTYLFACDGKITAIGVTKLSVRNSLFFVSYFCPLSQPHLVLPPEGYQCLYLL
jgi:hypothetical protein